MSTNEARDGARRLEFKYRLTYPQYYKVRNALLPYMKPDFYTIAAPGKKYLVRSLYFDTYDYRTFYEKMSGDSERIKLRIRTYAEAVDDNPIIRVELKIRKGNAMEKYGSFVSAADYLYFMRQRHWPAAVDPVLAEFERYVHLKELEALLLVEYRREGFSSRCKDDLRITFDHRVRSAQAEALFPAKPVFFQAHHRHNIILEIKFQHRQPSWLSNLVRSFGLQIVANSKFTQGIQVARQDLYRPDGVVVIR